ncbi:MAG: spermidine synthase [Magnetococcales bacterium]|nr:spermidine synthase [Magnetococcales bacterium]
MTPVPHPSGSRSLLLLLFFLSGVAGLIYESIWTHYLKLFLGHAAYAQTLVLALFMGGMALGAWLASRLSHHWKNPLLAYAAIEGVIGLAALLFHPLFTHLVAFSFATVIPTLQSVAAIHLYKWLLAGAMILPQSILLGMTFPLMSGGLLRLFPATPGGSIALLYFTNSTGGALGVLASGFFTIQRFGLHGTLALAGGLNLLLAAMVWLFFRRAPPRPPAVTTPGHSRQTLLLWVACLTGCASFIYEISWLRMLSLVLGASTHAFELMLSAFILGLAGGGWWVAKRLDSLANLSGLLAAIQILMGMTALATLPVYGHTFTLMQWLMHRLEQNDTGYLLFNLASHGIAMGILFPTAFCAGMTLPLITKMLLAQNVGEKAIGRVYGINTLGAILGIVYVVHVGLPLLGLKGALLSGAALDIGLGLLLVVTCRPLMPRWLPPVAWPVGLGCLAATGWLVELNPHQMASGVYRSRMLMHQSQRVLQQIDGKTATVSLTASPEEVYSLRTNGKTDASISMPPRGQRSLDEVTMTLTAAIPMLTRPQSRTIANIGFGSGMTSHVALADPALTRLDTIEIEPAIIATARRFSPYNDRVFQDPRSTIHIEDAKTFFSTRQTRYDIILSEPSNPWVSGVAGLFSREFYHDLKRHLLPGGLLAQWLQVYEFDLPLLYSVLKAVHTHFRHFTIYAVHQGDLLILASDHPIGEIPDQPAWPVPALREDLARIGVEHPQDLRLRLLGDERFLAPLLRQSSAPVNSDYTPYVDQHAVRARFLGGSANDLFFPVTELLPIRNLLARRETSAGLTRVTATPLSSLSVTPHVATLLRAWLTGAPVMEPVGGQPELVTQASRLRQVLADCRNLPEHGDKVYLMYQMGVIVLPHLHPDELQAIWTALESLPCGQGLQEHEERWLTLFKAIGRRDPPAMLTEVNRLLAQKPLLTRTRGTYLFGIGLLSLLAQERHGEALAFWDRHLQDWFERSTPPLAYQYLRAVAEVRTDDH